MLSTGANEVQEKKKPKQLEKKQHNLLGCMWVMKQQPSCLKVFAATASSLVLRIDSSPRWRASKDLLCSQSYPDVLLTYLTCSSVIRGCVSTEHGSKPQVCSAPEFLGATALHVPCRRIWPWRSPTCRHVSDRARGSSLACSMPLTCLPFPLHNRRWLHLGVAEAQEILERRAGVGESQHYSYLSLPRLPPSCLVSGCLGGKYLIPGQNCLTSGITFWDVPQLYIPKSQDPNCQGKQPALKSCPS